MIRGLTPAPFAGDLGRAHTANELFGLARNIEPTITSIHPVPFNRFLRRSSVLSNANLQPY